jgi:lysostaphin
LSLHCLPASGRVAISVSDESPKQGQTVSVFLKLQEPAKSDQNVINPPLEFNQHSYQVFPVEIKECAGSQDFQLLLAIPADLAPGSYKIRCGSDYKEIKVLSARFPVQRLRLPKGKDSFDASPGEEKAVGDAKATVSSERFWRDAFGKPADARVSTVFGVRRIVNGKLLTDYYHSGLDFAAPLGAPVRACAAGKVIMIGKNWKLHGNALAVDHGQSVVSFYIHLQKVLVKEGQLVKRGQIIGRVGQSGRASGPHLHFSLYVNQVATNPVDWFKQEF